ncbi:FabG-like 3-oxoacyl-(acyl-carrier-protein) reductase [Paraconexibacter sp. AEG42_29]|uniref:FabG-like 3-oxoacyl-(Acyl-carrier-protein) reductase n=1 Tax=Paraconexibacter sp. AEG42_29 TaxID=2997339 RepID=A0AAU7AXN0_9ACTN
MSEQVALITGAASGFGRDLTRVLTGRGVRVLACDVDEDGGAAVAAETGATFLRTDVSDPEQSTAAVAAAVDAFGGLDIAFLNAGIVSGTGLGEGFDLVAYRRAMGVNLDGVVFGINAVVPALKARGGGVIVCTASLAGLTAVPMDPLYSANKHAVVGLVRSLGPSLAADGIRINAVCPGFADTAIIAPIKGALADMDLPIIPVSQVTDTVLGLLDGDMTGECWFVQAGRESDAFGFRNIPGPRGAPAA